MIPAIVNDTRQMLAKNQAAAAGRSEQCGAITILSMGLRRFEAM
jgi:hypothetical protein